MRNLGRETQGDHKKEQNGSEREKDERAGKIDGREKRETYKRL